ncbi:uncharacterized protein [Nicotiana tomentosiformis]|uniref:uncharacterized protein n=1 Tax=Nicotiana tomentosiformis TaxID=4098 RepID=UPI00388CC832
MGSNIVVGALFQEGTSQVRPSYFNGQHFSHWKVRIETYIMSYDIKVWHVIKKRNLPIPPKKDENGQVIVSTDPLDLDDYTDEQSAAITVNAKAKNLLHNAISGEEYEKISSCEIAKEMWDKLEATYEGTNKVKETRINLLIRDYKLFQMKDGESVEEIFLRFSKILGDLKSFGRPTKNGEHVRKILKSLPTIWQPKVIALECQDLGKMAYDELRGDLIAFKKTHLDRKIQQEKKKTVAFKAIVAEPENEEEEEGGEQDENIAMLSQVITSMMRKNINSKRDSKKDSGEHGLMVDEGTDEEEDSGELGLMADEGTSEVRFPTYPNFYELQEFVDIALADIERVLNKLRKIEREKKDWALKLEVCEIENDMLQDEVNELQLQLNGLRKSSSHSSVKSNQIAPHTSLIRTRNPTACSYCGKNGHNTNQCRNRIRVERGSENPNNPSCFYCKKLGHTSNRCRFKDNRRWEHRKKNRKGIWYLDRACSTHMTGDKQLFQTVTTLDGGTVTFGDKSKENVIGVGKVRFKKHCWFIEDESCKVILSGNRDRNVYTISNVDNLGKQICLASMIDDPWIFSKDHICDACQLGKQTRSSFKIKNIVSTIKPLQLLHMDLFGPTRTASIGDRKYAFVIVDDFSCFTWVNFLSHKYEDLRNFEVLCKKVQRKKGYYIFTIRNDHGGEFESRAFENFCNDQGISHNFYSPRSPQ